MWDLKSYEQFRSSSYCDVETYESLNVHEKGLDCIRDGVDEVKEEGD